MHVQYCTGVLIKAELGVGQNDAGGNDVTMKPYAVIERGGISPS